MRTLRLATLSVIFFLIIYNLCWLPFLLCLLLCLLFSVEPVGSWFIHGTGTLCPPTSPHSQFGSPMTLSPSHGCERYSSLRNHRSAPYSGPYAHRTNSPSESPVTYTHALPLCLEPQSSEVFGFREGITQNYCLGIKYFNILNKMFKFEFLFFLLQLASQITHQPACRCSPATITGPVCKCRPIRA